jgi:ribonuclease BN (tRNA processing enzyme)
MRLVVVGCGTVVPEADRGCSCYYLEHGDVRALLDCGPGAVQAAVRLGIPWDRLTHLFITHFHADHVGALPGLFFAFRHGIHPPRVEAPLEVVGPPGTRALFRDLAAALGDFLLEPGFPVVVGEIVAGVDRLAGGLAVSAHEVPHTPESIALRFECQGTTLVYTGDTGPDEGLAEFARDADLLVAECSLPDDLVGDNHLSPSRLARLARRAGARRLVATHVYPQFRQAADVMGLISSAGYGGPAELAAEGLEIHL